MAKGEARGIKSFIPSWRGVVKILIVLIVIKFISNYAYDKVPASVQRLLPVF